MRVVIKLAIAALIVHGAWRAGSAYLVYYRFKDGLTQAAQFGATQSDQQIHNRAMQIAAELQVPLAPEAVSVRRVDNHIFIDAAYATEIEILPTYRHPWEFRLNIDAFSVVPPSLENLGVR